MTSKLKQSIAVQRQIPEHIRNNYPVFVEFIKLYYDFLQDTQAQDLEGIRDVDTTLEEFIDKFKTELSNNFPVDLAQDKRLLLKHLKEFYLSRGSEASFKFLFRTLFSKEAELYYPSQQILRVSDGRWKQDISVFVEITGSTTTLAPIDGQFITITTSRKTLTTFVENVVEYSTKIYEVFIQRDYVNEIEVGSTISFSDGTNTYTGVILPCPTKVSIFKGGSGFKVGTLYSLQTSIGRGCIIKVTKVGTIGDIKAIQVISFGLDYKTKFYSYLSNKDIPAYEYIHPAHLNRPYNPANAAYTERTGGFVEYGYASKQTYMYDDITIPVADAPHGSDRLYADSSYVGEIVQQFYVDQTSKVIDETLAIIEISLGAVAKYPGYYLTANGFISDEMYIHDGEYYQAFSYVVKVEEELRKYADILKALIHPAGMKMYAEYNIFKELKVSFVQPSIERIMQFADTTFTSDNGYTYSDYIISSTNTSEEIIWEDGLTYLIPGLEYTPAPGAVKVFSPQGRAASYVTKFIANAVTEFDYISTKDVSKQLIDTIDAAIQLYSAYVEKPLNDALPASSEALANAVAKPFGDSINAPTHTNFANPNKTLDDQLPASSEAINNRLIAKPLNDALAPTEALANAVAKPFANSIDAPTEALANGPSKPFDDSIDAPTEAINNRLIEKPLDDALPASSEAINNRLIEKPFDNSIDAPTEALANAVAKPLDDAINDIIDALILARALLLDDSIDSPTEALANGPSKPFDDSIDAPTEVVQKSDKSKRINDSIDAPTEALAFARALVLADILNIPTEAINNRLIQKPLSDAIDAPTEALVNSANISKFDSTLNTTTNGRITLSPYDLEQYFELFSDFQPSTTIS